MKLKNPRVRFAPAPTGMMHLGNIRTALMNYLIAKQKDGTFIIRVEDTDPERNFDPGAVKIMEDLAWLGLDFQEGPGKDGGFGPYFQSERTDIYKKKLQEFIDKDLVYRCFCTSEELDKKRARQIALKKPPRYDRTCLELGKDESNTKAESTPFIWRMKLDHDTKLTINDLSHDTVTFDLKNFSDFPITRQNGTVTFMFANFVDDSLMNISCAIRGEDHLSNTAGQAAMYTASGEDMPAFWHMPILCNIDGKKLSKRDFGFSLRDLKDAGFLPEAIINYLAIIGASFKNEIMSLEELTQAIDYDHLPTTGQIKYDVDKLRWVNHKWICQSDTLKITQLCRPYLEESYPAVKDLSDKDLAAVVEHVQKEMVTLRDAVRLLAFYFDKPAYEANIANTLISADKRDAFKTLLTNALQQKDGNAFVETLKSEIKTAGIKPKEAFSYTRYALTGSPKGPGVGELIEMLGYDTSKDRIEKLLNL
jgi:nondiscriminating glutamyl-tRNA synthetase